MEIKEKANEIRKNEISGSYKDIKPQNNLKINDVKKEINNKSEVKENYFSSYQNRIEHTPKEGSPLGRFEGQRGESKFIPSNETSIGSEAKKELKTAGVDGIEYKNGIPDFAPVSKCTVKIDNMTGNRLDYFDSNGKRQKGNFTQAYEKMSVKFNEEKRDGKDDWTARDVKQYKTDNNLTVHEKNDTKTVQLVPYNIHAACSHLGGCGECNIRDGKTEGGKFDE